MTLFGPTPTRREFLTALGVALVGVACGRGARPGGGTSPPGAKGSLADLTAGAEQLSLLAGSSPANPGKIRFAFGLTTTQGQIISGGQPEVWVGKGGGSKALGPFRADWYEFTGYEKTGDRSPKGPLPGTYVATPDIAEPGTWQLAVVAASGSGKGAATGSIRVTGQPVPAALGSPAVSVPTPVATTETKLKQICTRKPPCRMHAVSLDDALSNGKPTVVSFATPLLCESRLCGPVVDEQILASRAVGTAEANFIHVEEFPPGPDLRADASTIAVPFQRWGFVSEPWVIVIDRGGTVRARMEGPTTAPEIEAAVRPLL